MLEFLTLKPKAFALDISDLSLKLVKLEKNKKGFTLVSFLRKEITPGIIEKGEIKNQDALIDIIKSSISEVKGKPLDTKYVVASLPEEKTFLQVIQLPLLKEEEVKEAAKFEAENYIPFPINQVYLDSRIVKPVSGRLGHLDVLIAAIPKTTVDPYVFCLKKAGLVPLALEIESQATARALVKDQVSDFPLLLLDIGATRTSFIVFSGHSIRFTSSIPIASEEFTRAITKNLKLNLKEAEAFKLKYGLLGPKKVELKGKEEDVFEKKIKREERFFKAFVPVLTNFTEEIKKRIDYYQSHISREHLPPGGKGIEKILLCGGGANLKALDQFFSSELKTPTTLANPWINILLEGKKEVPQLPFKESLSFATALGLALKGTREV